MDGSEKDSEGAQKKTPLEDLSKEALIKKCKNLLLIAQKAKHAKDEASEEVKRLNERLNVLQSESNSKDVSIDDSWKEREKEFQNQISAMEEMLASLTEQKLQFTMQADSLKKQNDALEKQMKDLKNNEAKLKERVCDLETTAESYKRQIDRLTNENDTLIQQLETLEVDMVKKLQQAAVDPGHVKQLEEEVQVLREECNCLRQEDARKKDQMKHLYNDFQSKKIEFENEVKEERKGKELEIQNLQEELRIIKIENERMLTDIQSFKENNNELASIVKTIGAERDVFSQECIKLKEEIDQIKKHVHALESEVKSLDEANRRLELENQNLVYLLENSSSEIKSENNLLKAEKQELNEKLHSLNNENEKLCSALHSVEHQLKETLRHYQIIAGDIDCDNVDTSILGLITLVEKSLSQAFSQDKLNSNLCCKDNKRDFDSDLLGDEPVFTSDILAQTTNYFKRLYDEINLLNTVISNLESEGELLQKENTKLKSLLNSVRKQNLETSVEKVPDEFQNDILGTEEPICKGSICVCCARLQQTEVQLQTYKKDLEIKTDIVAETEKKLTEVNHLLQLTDVEEELRNELIHVRKCLSEKNMELNLLRDELSCALGRQSEFAPLKRKSAKSCRDTTEENNSEVIKLLEDIESTKKVVKCLQEEIANLEVNVKVLQKELVESKEVNEKLQYEKDLKDNELSKLKEELLSIQEQQIELEALRNEVMCSRDSEKCLNDTVNKLTKEIKDLNECIDKCNLFDKASSESKILQEDHPVNLEHIISELKNRVDQNSELLQEKNLELEQIKTDLSKLVSEKEKLVKETQENYKLLDEKELELRSLKDLISTLEVTKLELVDKVQELESEAQKLKFLLDEKSVESSSANEEIQTIRESTKQSLTRISELKAKLESKEQEAENLKTSLLKSESNLAEAFVKLSVYEEECARLQSLSDASKGKVMDLEEQLEASSSQISELQSSLEAKSIELGSVVSFSEELEAEIEDVKSKLKKMRDSHGDLTARLSEEKQSNACQAEKLAVFLKTEDKLKKEIHSLKKSYDDKLKEFETVTDEMNSLQSRNSELNKELNLSRSRLDESHKLVNSLKKELSLNQEQNERLMEDLQIARFRYEDKVMELENISSELMNVENASAETVARLTAVTAELDSVKDVRLRLENTFGQLNDLTGKFTNKEEELQENLRLLEEANGKNNQLKSKLRSLQSGLESLSAQVIQLNDLRRQLSDEVKTLKTTVLSTQQQQTWNQIQKTVTHFVEAEVAVVKKENAELLGEMNEMNQALKQRGESISKLKEINNELDQRLKDTCNKFDTLQTDLKTKNSELDSKEKIVNTLKNTLDSKEQTIQDLEKEVLKFKECQHELETKMSTLEAKEEKIHHLEAELVKQADRTKDIEFKNKLITDLEQELEALKLERKQKDSTNETDKSKELEEEVTSLKSKIQQLEREAEEMRRENGDAPSEVMSSSTISRADESARMKDLEESFEDRYTKLRTVAVKLKKKSSELTAQLTQVEADKKKLITDKSDLQAKVTQLSAHAKNLQTMQQEYDRLQDDLEAQKKEVKQLTKALEAAVSESANIKVQLQECQQEKEHKIKELENFMKDKQNLEAMNKELVSHNHSLKKEKEAENITKKEKEKEIKRLEDEIKNWEKRLADEVELQKKLQEQLEITKQECKKRSVLSLEMEDYEKSVADLTQQLSAEKQKVKELDSHLDTQRDISRGLQDQISLLEQRIQSEEARSSELKEQLDVSRVRTSELEALGLERETQITELTSQIEQHRDKNENFVLELSELAAEKHRLVESGRSQQDALVRQVHILEEHVSRLKESLAERETELGDLRAEFGNYKVRAQSVLRQKTRPEEGVSSFSKEDCLEEMSQLRQTVGILRNKLEDASTKLQTLTVENNTIQEDRARMAHRCHELVDTVQDLRSQNSQLQTQLQDMAAEHREAMKSQKLQAETLNQCYKQQLEELEECLKKETAALKKQLQEAEERMNGLQRESTDNVLAKSSKDVNVLLGTPSNNTGFVPVRSHRDSENRFEISLLEREEGEGSESVDSIPPDINSSQDQRNELIPLDKLLSSPPEDDLNILPAARISPTAELGRTKEQLIVSECRLKHLTGLLSEAERDLAKLTQQNQVLKEEIRRQQRSVEREQHAQNFEYLKNVVLKFVTLQGGDERSRLVPVLNTILKLSPEETQQLNIVAKGGPDLQGGGRGWGSYLQIWSGSQ